MTVTTTIVRLAIVSDLEGLPPLSPEVGGLHADGGRGPPEDQDARSTRASRGPARRRRRTTTVLQRRLSSTRRRLAAASSLPSSFDDPAVDPGLEPSSSRKAKAIASSVSPSGARVRSATVPLALDRRPSSCAAAGWEYVREATGFRVAVGQPEEQRPGPRRRRLFSYYA
ncbi:hypothetical protein DL765_002707 [Monosporascus sp. GIB2]|nr:hypothetical protein DL765_002707 [Monosporascus sp. GIB2]